MARICIEYECEVQESQRRPTNLLDALERGDHHGGEDSDAVVGEEKVHTRLSFMCEIKHLQWSFCHAVQWGLWLITPLCQY